MTRRETTSPAVSSFVHPTKLGLDDPRVIKCLDRGDQFYRQDHPLEHPSSHNIASLPPNCPEKVRNILEELEEAQISYPPESASQFFIPRDQFSRIMTFERVQLVINTLSCCETLSPKCKQELAREIYFGGGPTCRAPCLKLLAALIGARIQDGLLDLINDGVTDHCLPLECVPDDRNSLRCRCQGHQHPAIDKYGRGTRRTFCQWSYAVTPLYLKRPQNGHVHYILRHNDVLPIIKSKAREPSKAPLIQQSKNKNSETSSLTSGYGGFSQVKRVIFHPSQFEFGSYGVSGPI